MMFGYFDDRAFHGPHSSGGAQYSHNPVYSSAGGTAYHGGGGGASPNVSSVNRNFGQGGGYDAAPVRSQAGTGADYSGLLSAGGNFVSNIGSDINRANQLGAAATLSQGEIPSDPSYMVPMLDQMAREGTMLRESTLGKMPREAARTAGARAADQRGLSGPLAASVAANSEQEAQQGYDRYRQGALTDARTRYMQLVGQYKASAQARLAKLLEYEALKRKLNAATRPEGAVAKYGLGAAGGILGYLIGGGAGASAGSALGLAGGGALQDSMGSYNDPRVLEQMNARSAFGTF